MGGPNKAQMDNNINSAEISDAPTRPQTKRLQKKTTLSRTMQMRLEQGICIHRSNPYSTLTCLPTPSAISRTFVSVRCGPRDNRGPLVKGRILSSEAIHAIQSLKRSHRSGFVADTLPSLRRLLKSDLLSVLRELLRQDHCTLAVHVLSTLRSEYPPLDLTLYADVVNALSRNGLRDEIDLLIRDLDAIGGGDDGDKSLVKLLKAVIGAGRRESAVRIYSMMRNAGWGSAAWEADEYVSEVLSKGLRRLGEEELSHEVAKKREIQTEKL